MREQRPDEDRIEYLAKVLHAFMDRTSAGECVMVYDGVECDGLCLAYDVLAELGLEGE